MAHNGPRIGDSGGLESLNFQSCTKLSNSLLLFSKFMKKRKYKRLLRQKKEKLSISPLNRHFANTICVPCIRRTHSVVSKKNSKIQICGLRIKIIECYFSRRCKSFKGGLTIRTISTSQAGLRWPIQWRNWNGKIRYWRAETSYEAS